jgi:hypothetical protein
VFEYQGVNGVNTSVENGGVNTDDVVRAIRAILHVAPQAQSDLRQPAKEIAPVTFVTKKSGTKRYALAFVMATALGMGAIFTGNQSYAPEMYGQGGMAPAAAAHAQSQNYAVFDLNLNIRALREEQLKRMTKTPDVIILGASHWQEAHKDLLRGQDFFNAHIHRDYWEDPLGMVELLERYNRLPKRLIISLRDKQFTPVDKRKDYLWEPGIPAYRVMSEKLGLPTESYIKTLPYNRAQAQLSLPMFFENFTRWYNAAERPGPTSGTGFEALDVLLPDGSISWSNKKMRLFTAERTKTESFSFADKSINDPPQIDPMGVAAFDKLLTHLKEKGVKVYLVKPPFNPMFFDRVQGTPYAEGLGRVEATIQKFATDHQLPLFGSFNPHEVGCTSSMYIDAEHSHPECLKKVFDQFVAIENAEGGK